MSGNTAEYVKIKLYITKRNPNSDSRREEMEEIKEENARLRAQLTQLRNERRRNVPKRDAPRRYTVRPQPPL
jgi:cell division protein FtsB